MNNLILFYFTPPFFSFFQDEEQLQDNINNLNTDITIKQKLIDELEHSQQRLTALKHQYEQKMGLLHNKIKETEDERDKVCSTLHLRSFDVVYGGAQRQFIYCLTL